MYDAQKSLGADVFGILLRVQLAEGEKVNPRGVLLIERGLCPSVAAPDVLDQVAVGQCSEVSYDGGILASDTFRAPADTPYRTRRIASAKEADVKRRLAFPLALIVCVSLVCVGLTLTAAGPQGATGTVTNLRATDDSVVGASPGSGELCDASFSMVANSISQQ